MAHAAGMAHYCIGVIVGYKLMSCGFKNGGCLATDSLNQARGGGQNPKPGVSVGSLDDSGLLLTHTVFDGVALTRQVDRL